MAFGHSECHTNATQHLFVSVNENLRLYENRSSVPFRTPAESRRNRSFCVFNMNMSAYAEWKSYENGIPYNVEWPRCTVACLVWRSEIWSMSYLISFCWILRTHFLYSKVWYQALHDTFWWANRICTGPPGSVCIPTLTIKPIKHFKIIIRIAAMSTRAKSACCYWSVSDVASLSWVETVKVHSALNRCGVQETRTQPVKGHFLSTLAW